MKLLRTPAAVLTLVACMAVAVAVAGCGGGDKDKNASTTSAPNGPELTKPQYIAAADKICKATSDKISAAAKTLRDKANKTGTLAVPEVTKFLTTTSLPSYDAMLKELQTLTPPAADATKIDGLIGALAGAIKTAKDDPVKYSKNNAPDPFADANARALSYGMRVCGSA
jgi:hypothetical protein